MGYVYMTFVIAYYQIPPLRAVCARGSAGRECRVLALPTVHEEILLTNLPGAMGSKGAVFEPGGACRPPNPPMPVLLFTPYPWDCTCQDVFLTR